jgi:hypothetical protein
LILVFVIEDYIFEYLCFVISIYNKNNEDNILSEIITFNSDDSNHEKYYLFVNKDTVNFNSVVTTNYKDNSNYVDDVIKILLGW